MATSNIGNMGVTSYVYDGEGRRIEKTSSTFTSYYVYDSSGDPVAEYTTETQPVYGTLYVTPDHLGSTRLLTNGNGDVVRRYDYLPFGEEIPSGSYSRGNDYGGNQYPNAGGSSFPGDAASHKFTGKERDAETGLDYFGARYFSGAQGRFTSPDWSVAPQGVPYATLTDPQTLNLYGYVSNNPLSRTDLDGHCLEAADNSSCLGDEKFEEAQRPAGPLTDSVVLPKTPAGLGPEWARDLSDKSPNRESWVRGDNTRLDFDKAQPGKPGWRGKDHWHVTKPGESDYDKSQGSRGHISPGTAAELPDFPTAGRVQLPPELTPYPWAGTDTPMGPARSLIFPGFIPTGIPVGSPALPLPVMPWEPVLVW